MPKDPFQKAFLHRNGKTRRHDGPGDAGMTVAFPAGRKHRPAGVFPALSDGASRASLPAH